MANLKLMPIGSIIAWVMKPNKESEDFAYLPDGWIRCDGSTIDPPSIWAGSATPNLNGQKRFLRGGDDSEILDTQDDQIQDLQLSISDNGHTHTENGHNHEDIIDRYEKDSHTCLQSSGQNYRSICHENDDDTPWWTDTPRKVSTENIEINSAKTSVSIVSSDYRRGDETRPVNTKVIWIMRVW